VRYLTATGQVNTVGIDVATVIQQISKSRNLPRDPRQRCGFDVGTAAIDAILSGVGGTPRSLGRLAVAGEIKCAAPR